MKDKELGLDRPITRRDLIHGLGALAGTAVLPGRALADAMLTMEKSSAPYPPALTGLRGNHTGSWEAAHALAREGKPEWGPADSHDMTGSNEVAELLDEVPAKFNRLVFYPGDLPHGACIRFPERLSDDPRAGRLTLNTFVAANPR